jgi:hypothetical protein
MFVLSHFIVFLVFVNISILKNEFHNEMFIS